MSRSAALLAAEGGLVTESPRLADATSERPPVSGSRRTTARPSRSPRRSTDARPTARPPEVAARAAPLSPEEHLARAMAASSPRGRAMWARRGLASRSTLDRTTQAMLLRQLYLSCFEQRRFEEAHEASRQSLDLGVLRDVVHQDAARACAAMGDVDGAAGHLRLAARHGPASRRAFHWWTLGSLYFNAGRHAEAIGALARSARWGTRDKPLYQAHLAVARCASGARVTGLGELFERLEAVPAGQGYGRFVLGHLAFYLGSHGEARRHLRAFVERTASGRLATAIALDAELTIAKRTLAAIEDPGR